MKNGDRARGWRWNTATLAATFAVLLTTVMLTVFGVLVAQGHRDRAAWAEDRAQANVQLLSIQASWLVTASLQALERIHDKLENEPFAPDDETVSQVREAISHLPGEALTAVFGPNGDIQISDAGLPEDLNIAHLPYFQALQAGQFMHISPVLLPREGDRGGFAIARRLESEGDFAGIAVIAISDEMLEDFSISLGLGPDSTLGIVAEDGWLASRYPPPDEPLFLGDYELFTVHMEENPRAGIYTAETSPADGVSRVVAYQNIPGVPLIAVSGVAVDGVYGTFWRSVAIVSALMLPVAAALLVLAYLLWRAAVRDQRIQARLHQALERNNLLFREIHHRVKNNLQAVGSLIQLQPIAPEAKKEMGRRLSAMIAVHEHIYSTDQFEQTDIADYIRKLVSDIAASFDSTARVSAEIESVTVHRDHAMPLGLILNEVLCNSMKYAFADGRQGTISVSLKPVSDMHACLRVEDNGVGLDPDAATNGLGHTLIKGLSQQIGGTYTLTGNQGTKFELVFPLEPAPGEEE